MGQVQRMDKGKLKCHIALYGPVVFYAFMSAGQFEDPLPHALAVHSV